MVKCECALDRSRKTSDILAWYSLCINQYWRAYFDKKKNKRQEKKGLVWFQTQDAQWSLDKWSEVTDYKITEQKRLVICRRRPTKQKDLRAKLPPSNYESS